MAQETVLINFEVDYTELTNAQEQLAKAGKIDNKGFQDIQKAINTTATDTKGLITKFKEVAGASIKMGKTVEAAFGAGIQDALDEAGVSLKDFEDALKKANAPAITLKKELQQLKEAMARMKVEGKDTGKEFDALRSRAGKLADAIQDANAEIKNAGSDTRGIDNVIGSVSALAGGFAAVQGATALFGDESEDLQKALLKVNGAMALASGLQQFYNATLKEGALTKLADSIATGAQSAAQAIYTTAIGTSTGALKTFRLALLATGIGVLIAAIVLAYQAMKQFGDNTGIAIPKTEDLTKKLDDQTEAFRKLNDKIEFNGKLRAQNLRAQGASENAIFQDDIRQKNKILENLQKQRDATTDELIKNEELLAKVNAKLNVPAGRGSNPFKINALKNTRETLLEQNKIIKDDFEVKQGLVLKQSQEIRLLEATNAADIADDKRKADAKYAADKKAASDKAIAQAKIDADKAYEDMIAYENKVAKLRQDERDKDYAAHLKDLEKMAADRKKFYDNMLAAFNKNNDDEEAEYMEAYNKKIARDAKEDADAKAKAAAEDELFKKRIQNYLNVANQVADFYSLLSTLATQQDTQRINEQKKQLDSLLKAGAITEKQARIRAAQIEIMERAARQRAAQREKQAAVFKALIAIPQAFLQGLSQGGYILAAIYAALAAATAAVIIARPVPKFFKGKKDRYEGPGTVADMGSELVERGGRMYLYTKPTQTYLGANDKVYTAAETRNIMHNTNINTTVQPKQQPAIDYDRLGKAIPRDSIVINFDKDFISESVANGLSKNNYFNNRYQFKK